MKISKVSVTRKFLPFLSPWRVGSMTVAGKHHVVVAVASENGLTGYGATAPLPEFSGETGPGAEYVIAELIGPRLIGMDAFDIGAVVKAMDSTISHNHLAKSAVDMAVHDLQGKALGLPVYKLLGGRVRNEVRLCWAIAASDIDDVLAAARARVAEGYTALKLKVGKDLKDTRDRLVEVRKAVGDGVSLRLDINERYSPDDSVKLINLVEDVELEYVEQPAPGWDLDAMAWVKGRVGVPIMVDEGVFSVQDLIRVIRKNAASIVNLKIGKLGGLHNARTAAEICDAAGLTGMIGCMLESDIAMVAGAHLGVSMHAVDIPCELIGHRLYAEGFIDMAPFDRCSSLVPTDAPGLGFPGEPAVV